MGFRVRPLEASAGTCAASPVRYDMGILPIRTRDCYLYFPIACFNPSTAAPMLQVVVDLH